MSADEDVTGSCSTRRARMRRRTGLAAFAAITVAIAVALGGCAGLPNRDPLTIDVAGIDPLPGEGMELRLSVRIRIQNPNDVAVEYTGAALRLDINGARLASGVSDRVGTVPRYGETVFEVPVTISAFDMARQVLGFVNATDPNEVRYRVRGKLEGGLFGTRRFADEGSFRLDPARAAPRP